MIKIMILIFVVASLFILNSCSSPVICSSPYMLTNGDCCLDSDDNGKCDSENIKDIGQSPIKDIVPNGVISQEQETNRPNIPKTKTVEEITIDVGDDLYIGSLNPKVVIISYGNYQDKFSQRFNNEILPKIIERYHNNILYIYRNYLKPEHRFALKAAEAANCAKDQGKFLEYHNILFNNINDLKDNDLIQYAEELGLETNEFKSCLNSVKYYQEVKQDTEKGDVMGVSILPTVFINGLRIVGFRDFEIYKEVIDNFLIFDLSKKRKNNKISASSAGKAYQIHIGESVSDETVKKSPYTNNIGLIEARFSLDASDKTIEDVHEDDARLSSEIKIIRYGQLVEDFYKIKFKELNKDDIYDGGIVTNTYINGFSKLGTKELPKVFAYVYFSGKADVFDKNNNLLLGDAEINFIISQGIRVNGLLSGSVDKDDKEAYLFIPGIFGKENIPFPNSDGFLYVFWEDVYDSLS